MAVIKLESHHSKPDNIMSKELHDRLLGAGIVIPEECVSFDIVADVGEIVSVTWRCHATRSLLAALGNNGD